MDDDELMGELYRRFHSASETPFSVRVMALPTNDLSFVDTNGNSFGEIKHLVRGDDKSGASFDIYRLGWSAGRVWELVIIDGAYLPHLHRNINSEFFIISGHGYLSRDHEWSAYRERTTVSLGMAVAHGFITDPEFGPTVFLSIQSDPIRKFIIDPETQSEKFEDDFVYVDEAFPLPRNLVELRKQKLAALKSG